MNYFSINIDGKQQTIRKNFNDNFEKAVSIFRLFDDSLIIQSVNYIAAFDQSFRFRFYINEVIECDFDVFMMACLLRNIRLINLILDKNKSKLNNEYQFGSGNYTTPFSCLVNDFGVYKRILERITDLGDYTKTDSHGELLIPESNKI